MPRHTRSAHLSTWQQWLLISSGVLLWLSGGVWLLLHYFGRVEGDFGFQTNPWEPWMLRLHGAALIPMLLGVGTLFVAHIPKGWRVKRQRVAGISLTVFLGLLVISGYLLYYVGSKDARAWISIIHWVVGLALPLVFLWHYLKRRPQKIKPAKQPPHHQTHDTSPSS